MTAPIYLDKCVDYSSRELDGKINNIACGLGLEGCLRSQKILLKPNLIAARAPAVACTNVKFLLAIAKWFKEQGCEVSIGDSPAFGTARGVLQSHGMLTELEKFGVEVVEFKTTKTLMLPSGDKVGVAAEAYNYDLLVNLPKIKAHSQMYVTMAVKNLFGLVRGYRKAKLHVTHGNSRMEFANMLLDLLPQFPQSVSFADGVEVMHKAGPIKGESYMLQLLGGAKDPVSFDFSLARALQIDCSKVPILVAAKSRGLLGSELTSLDFKGLRPEKFHPCGFQPPVELIPVSFHPMQLFTGSIKRMYARIFS